MQNEVFRMLLRASKEDPDIIMVVLGNGNNTSQLFPITNDSHEGQYYNIVKKIKTKNYIILNNTTIFGDTNEHIINIDLTNGSTYDFRWLYEVTKLKSFKSNKVTKFGDSCFKNASNLESCDCPNVTYYGIRIFEGSKLSGNYKVNENTISIGNSCFSGTKLVSLDLRCLITNIPEYCASNITTLKTVILGNNINVIKRFAFINDTQLENINVPTNLTRLEQECFYNTKLSTFDISNNNNVTYIGHGVFRNSKLSGSFVIPNSVTTLGYGIFNKTLITSINIPSQITSIGGNGGGALTGFCEYCGNLTTVVFNNVLENIGYHAFFNCTKLNIQQLPNSVKKIGPGAFFGTSALTNFVLYDGIEELGYNAFAQSGFIITRLPNSLKVLSKNVGSFQGDIIVPNGVTRITYNTFQSQLGLTSLEFGNDFTTIGDADDTLTHAGIAYCQALTKVIFGNNTSSLNYIGTMCFSGCPSLNTIVIYATTPPDLMTTYINNTCNIYVPDTSVNAYKNATNWSSYANNIHPISEYIP